MRVRRSEHFTRNVFQLFFRSLLEHGSRSAASNLSVGHPIRHHLGQSEPSDSREFGGASLKLHTQRRLCLPLGSDASFLEADWAHVLDVVRVHSRQIHVLLADESMEARVCDSRVVIVGDRCISLLPILLVS